MMLARRLKLIWADRAYNGDLLGWCYDQFKVAFDIVVPSTDSKGFVLLSRRWVVERTFAWFHNYRRLSKDYEYVLQSSEGMIYLASIHSMLKRLVS